MARWWKKLLIPALDIGLHHLKRNLFGTSSIVEALEETEKYLLRYASEKNLNSFFFLNSPNLSFCSSLWSCSAVQPLSAAEQLRAARSRSAATMCGGSRNTRVLLDSRDRGNYRWHFLLGPHQSINFGCYSIAIFR